MRKFAIVAAAAATLVAAPAFAQSKGEGRVEVRGGVAWGGGVSEGYVGGAVGYDFDISKNVFLGVEGAADKVLVGGSKVFITGTVRLGLKVGENGKVYALGGGGVAGGTGAGVWGAGYQQKFGKNFYGKIEYRRTISSGPEVNYAGAGLGFAF